MKHSPPPPRTTTYTNNSTEISSSAVKMDKTLSIPQKGFILSWDLKAILIALWPLTLQQLALNFTYQLKAKADTGT